MSLMKPRAMKKELKRGFNYVLKNMDSSTSTFALR